MRLITEEVGDDPAVGGPAAGTAEVGLPVRQLGEGPPGGGRVDGGVAGVRQGVAECKDAGVAAAGQAAAAAGVRITSGLRDDEEHGGEDEIHEEALKLRHREVKEAPWGLQEATTW